MNDARASSDPVASDSGERRRSPRVQALYHVVVTKNGGQAEESVTVGRTVDVSATGVCVQTPGHLCTDDRLRLEIAVEDRVVHAEGRVVRSARIGELIEAGIELIEIDESDRQLLSP